MNPLELQEELIDEFKRMFKGIRLKNPLGEMSGINIFAQNTPYPESDEEADPIPYIIVHLNNGEQRVSKDSFNIVNVAVIIGICDIDASNKGHRTVFDIIYKIHERFAKKPALKKASFTGDFKWVVRDEEFYPYFFGACEMDFYIPSIRRENDLS